MNESTGKENNPNSKAVSDVILRDVIEADISQFFEHQQDHKALYMAAFTAKDPTDESAFTKHWNKILADEKIIIKTILYHGQVAGHVLSFEQFGEQEVSYWIGKEYWGQGIATKALVKYLEQFKKRPLYARVVKDNIASIRVLEKCGFAVVGEDKGYANAREQEVEEYILKLESRERTETLPNSA